MTISLALASSLLWGVADFFGGKASRARPALLVVLISQAAGLFVALVAAVVTGAFDRPTGYLPWAVGAGLAGASAVVLFYRALAIGTMGVVAPLAAMGVVVPVIIGLFQGSPPSAICLAGIVIAIAGVVVTAGPGGSGGPKSRHTESVLLALAAAAGFGLLQYFISGGSQYSTVMTMVAMRATSVPALAAAAFLSLRSARGRGDHIWRFRPAALALVVAVGVCDVSANLLFALATVSGALAIVAVLGSLYPAATVLLARIIDHEKLSRLQNVGVAAAVTGVALIAGSS